MHFDDRLATVLRNRATGGRSARTQFRQLIDLLGERQQGGDKALRTAAYLRLIALGDLISVRERTSIVGEAGWRFRNADLVRWFGDAHPHIAAAALARAELSGEEWEQIIPTFPIHARGFLRNRKDLPPRAVAVLDRLGVADMALPRPEPLDLTDILKPAGALGALPPAPAPLRFGEPRETAPEVASPSAEADDHRHVFRQTGEGIRALVDRIEAFKRARENGGARTNDADQPRAQEHPAPERQPLDLIDFRADARGRIDWASKPCAPMLIGMDLSAAGDLAAGIAARQPVRGLLVTFRGASALEGDWVIDAAPRFSKEEGRFEGYVGRMRRAAPPVATARQKEADKLRQLLHELRTPVNAMQGYAEIIQQQMIGPVPHEYRAIAAEITGDAARILAGFDELDRLARLETGAVELESGSADFAAVVCGHVAQLQKVLSPRVARLDTKIEADTAVIDLAQTEAERLSWRLLATLAGATAAGERIALTLTVHDAAVRVAVALPTALRTLEDPFAAELRAAAGHLSSGIFGAGFSLRLARAEARAVGGALVCDKGRMVLDVPLAKSAATAPASVAQVDGAMR